MPKILVNAKESLAAEARRQVTENGYSATTIRSVARACRIGVGTVYNYFPSKEALVAEFVLEDWLKSLDEMRRCADLSDSPCDVLRILFDGLRKFAADHDRIFSDADAYASYMASFNDKHGFLRSQIAEIIAEKIPSTSEGENKFTSVFLAESIITWGVTDTPFETVYSVLQKIIE